MSRAMLPLGIASASLDVLNVPPADTGRPAVHAVPSRGARGAARRLPDTAVAAHALHASTCSIDVLGREAFALARVLQSGTELEVRIVGAGTDDAPPTSFTFAAPLLGNIGIFQDAHTSQVHVLAMTSAGALHRLQIPLATLLRGARLPSHWAQEHIVDALAQEGAEATSVHTVDAGLVLVACADGMLLQLKQSIAGDGHGFVGAWHESSLRPASFLYGVSRLFQRGVSASPGRHAVRAAPTQTLALASHVRENDAALAFCVCRDRKLRVWNLVSESCVRTLDLPVSFSAAASARVDDESDSDAFERTSVPMLQLFYPGEDDAYALYLLVFVPAPLPGGAFVAAYGVELEESSAWSGGVGEIALVWGKSCDARTQAADVELRDMALTRDGDAWRAWLLWHAGGAPLLQHTLALGAEPSEAQAVARRAPNPDEAWASILPFAQHAPLRGPDFDAALAGVQTCEEVAQFFLRRLLAPGRFSSTTLAAALRAFSGLPDTEAKELARPQHRPRLVEAIGASVGVESPQGDLRQWAEAVRGAWLRFARLVEQIDRSARWPLGLYVHDLERTPFLVSRFAIGAVLEKDAATWLGDLAQKLASAAQYAERAVSRAQGEAASAEFAAVVNSLGGVQGAYETIRERGVALLQTATCAAELTRGLGVQRDVWLAPALRAAVGAPLGLWAEVERRVPHALEPVRSHLAQLGADGLAEHLVTTTELLSAPLATAHGGAYYTAIGADALGEVVLVRERALESLVLLHAAMLHRSRHAALEASMRTALRAWQHAAALGALARLGAAPETVHDEALVPLGGLRLDQHRYSGRPATHLLHHLAQTGALACGVSVGERAALCFSLGEALPRDGEHAPLALLTLARHLLQQGFPSAVPAMLGVYAEDAPMSYLLALAETQTAQCAAGLRRLARIASVLSSALPEKTRLLAVLPTSIAESTGEAQAIAFYTHAAAYWESASDMAGALHCYRHACEALRASPAAASEADARRLWSHVFRGELALGQYEAATATLLAAPFDDLREVCLQSLVTALCEAGAFSLLLRLHFLEWQPRVERVLSFKARNAEPLSKPNYFQVLYAYHASRGDHKSAAASMYQHARRLHHAALALSAADVHAARSVLVLEAQSYLAAINALALLTPTHAWFAHALRDEAPASGVGGALQGGVTQYIPSERLDAHAQPLTIVQLADVRREYNELLARLELMRLYPELANPTAALRPEDAVNLFLAADDVDASFSAAHQLRVDMRNVFDALAQKCVALQRADAARRGRLDLDADTPDAALAQLVADDEEAADPEAAFLRHSPRAASWPGPAHERAWRFLRLHLGLADARGSNTYRTAIAERLVALGAWDLAPTWLVDWFTRHGPDLLVRTLMRHGALVPALEYSAKIVEQSVSAARTNDAMAHACLPYSLFDALLAAGADGPAAAALRQALDQRLHTLRTAAAS